MKVVVSNQIFPETRALLAGHAELDVNEAVEPWPWPEVQRRCRDAAALLAFMTDRLDHDFFAACPQLRVVGAALKGCDNIDVAAAERAGVWVTIVPELLTVPTAELAIGLMLAAGRRIVAGDRRIRAGGFAGWRPALYGLGLADATVGIVGFGKVGRAIAERLAHFRCRLLAFDMWPTDPPGALAPPVTVAGLESLLERSDYVILALPLTPATLHIVDRTAIARMKPGALLINTARGSLVDEAAVADAIETGRLSGYAADVFECEDWARPDRPALIEPRLVAPDAPTVLTPHLGSAVESVRRKIEIAAARSIIDALAGREPSGAVNRPLPRYAHAQLGPCQHLPDRP